MSESLSYDATKLVLTALNLSENYGFAVGIGAMSEELDHLAWKKAGAMAALESYIADLERRAGVQSDAS